MGLIRCPNCNNGLTFYISGHAEYHQKCPRCKEKILIYSAGATAICKENLSFSDIKYIAETNRYVDYAKIR